MRNCTSVGKSRSLVVKHDFTALKDCSQLYCKISAIIFRLIFLDSLLQSGGFLRCRVMAQEFMVKRHKEEINSLYTEQRVYMQESEQFACSSHLFLDFDNN